jgi:RNA polymerase sigma-70 factor (ECF subfamily)
LTWEQERQSVLWMRLAQGGDQAAYASLLAMLTSVTRQFARARVGDVGWVDDVVQETLLTIHGARHTYDPSRPFAPWFYAIASNRMIDVLRRERRVRLREIADDTVPEPPAEAVHESDIDIKAIHAALASLPARQRDVIEGMKFRDESVRDIASRTKMTESAVKVTAHRGYRTLRRLLGGRRED